MSAVTLELLAPCGVPCFACPSYLKGTCNGCRSEAPQKRSSKYGCKIRSCCLATKSFQLCNECDEVPCKNFHQKLLKTHLDEASYAYRRDTLGHFRLIQRVGLQRALSILDDRWSCSNCGGRIQFYVYTCFHCGSNFLDELQNYNAEER